MKGRGRKDALESSLKDTVTNSTTQINECFSRSQSESMNKIRHESKENEVSEFECDHTVEDTSDSVHWV